MVEIDTYGFRLYRDDDADFDNAALVGSVAAKGWDGFGAVYQHRDTDLLTGR